VIFSFTILVLDRESLRLAIDITPDIIQSPSFCAYLLYNWLQHDPERNDPLAGPFQLKIPKGFSHNNLCSLSRMELGLRCASHHEALDGFGDIFKDAIFEFGCSCRSCYVLEV
jgi:hypothetical protein